MTNWKHQLKLGDVFHNDDMTFDARRDAIVARIRATGWYKRTVAGEDGYELTDIVDDLADTKGADTFDEIWSNFYDWCDENRVWVETVAS